MHCLVAENLRRGFGARSERTEVLRGVSLKLSRGQVVLLMGPSGSGKSTLLALLSGLARPDEGRVEALGVDLWSLSDKQRERFRLAHFGFIFQGYNLFPSLTAREQLEMVIRWGEGASASVAQRRVADVLGSLELGEKGNLRPGQLSGGEKQRVAVARALIKQPEVCFADEPTAALDWGVGRQVVELLRDAAHRNNTLMFIVAHDKRLIRYADQVFYLNEGQLSQHDPESDLLNEGDDHG